MRKPVENFKGIEFVRISSLPREQQKQVWATFDQEKIIKIVKDQALINDCILYSDFQRWESSSRTSEVKPTPTTASVQPDLTKLAFK